MTGTAVANVEQEAPAQHPIITELDRRLPEIEAILPDGMRIDRFRKVVVQAMLRTPGLWDCTPISLITAITEAAEVGIEPTGVLGKGWLIPYRGEAKFIPGWRGFVDLLWRADRILVTVDVVRIGDEFSYRRGTDKYLHHTPDLADPEREASDDNVTFAYVLVQFPDGREDFEVMSRVALDRIKKKALEKTPVNKRDTAIWNLHPGEMMKKTPIRRIAKRLPLSPAVQAMLGRDEEIDYDTPVERVADPRREGLRDRIAERTAALRGGPNDPVESEGAELDGAAVPGSQPAEGDPTPSAGGSPAPRRGDPWMARLHAVGSERGYDHDALHDWAERVHWVKSLADLDPKQRGQFMAQVESLPLIGQTCAHPPAKHIVTGTAVTCGECYAVIVQRGSDTPEPEELGASAPATAQPESPPAPAARATDTTPAGQAVPPGSQPASFTDPASLETYAAAVLGFDEPQPLTDLTTADFDQVFAALDLAAPKVYGEWFERQERPIRQALRVAKQSPRQRADAAKEAAKRPDADQLRASLTEGDES